MTEALLNGLHAIVTGGGRGIGAAIAERLAQNGANVSLLGRTLDQLQATAQSIRQQFDQEVLPVTADVTDPEQIRAAFEQCRKELGDAQILINNAGAVQSSPLVKTELSLWDNMMAVNLRSSYLCIREVLPGMIKAGYGRIVNVASTAGLTGFPYVAAYCAAKHGVIGLTRALALETAHQGITVNAVCPGYVETDLLKNAVNNITEKTGRETENVREELLKNIPLGRFIQPHEVASATVWLCQKEQSGITGQTITLAGGEVV